MKIEDLPDPAPLHSHLLDMYYQSSAQDEAKHEEFRDTLKDYASAIMLASTMAILSLLNMEIEELAVIRLTDAEREALAASGTLAQYLEGKDRTDD